MEKSGFEGARNLYDQMVSSNSFLTNSGFEHLPVGQNSVNDLTTNLWMSNDDLFKPTIVNINTRVDES